MTSDALAKSYLQKAVLRLRVLDVLMDGEGYSDVVREAQELVELALKGLLRFIGIDPPKIHDVGGLVVQYADLLPEHARQHAVRLAEISKRLRKERELAFYGDIDFIPSEEYGVAQAKVALDEARWVVAITQSVIA